MILRMYGQPIVPLLMVVSLYFTSGMPTSTNDNTDGACEVRNNLIQYNINGHVATINIPECVVSTAYVIRSTITTNPEDQARFVEVNNGCCCEVVQFTKRQIRIGHLLHKYNEIEACVCTTCPAEPSSE